MKHQQKIVLGFVSNAELLFIRICSSLLVIINGQLPRVILMAQTILAFASSMAMVSEETLKQLQNATKLRVIMTIPTLIRIIAAVFEFLVNGMFQIALPGLLILDRRMTISRVFSLTASKIPTQILN
jgi:hypothetical protein